MNFKYYFFLIFISFQFQAQNNNKSIGFIENKGQIIDQKGRANTAVKYLLNTYGLNVQLRKNGFSYDVYEVKKHPLSKRESELQHSFSDLHDEKDKTPDYTLEYIYHRIDIDFKNSNSNVELIAEEKSSDYDNYYNIPNKPEGVVNVYKYKLVTYKNIYPNIDVVFSIPNDSIKPVEYNFVIHPKGKISDIQMKFNGAKTDLVDNKIKMNVRFGEMEETLPLSWTEEGKDKKEIAIGYTKIKKDVYGFSISDDIGDKTVIIDPVPVRLWGTFYGDETKFSYDIGQVSIVTDAFGNSYMTGTTGASNLSYATAGAHQISIPPFIYGSRNGIIVKFSPDGNRLWSTYYGGMKGNAIKDIKIDTQNNIVIAGNTQSQTNISTTGSYKPDLTGVGDTYDAFLVKFNDAGVRLWGTYFGGENDDSAYALDIDKNNNIYIVGSTSSETNIAINSNFQTKSNQGDNTIYQDGFLAKFEVGGNLIWSTYIGGENYDLLKAIKVKDNYLVAGGTTSSNNNIATAGAFQETIDSNYYSESMICKFSLDGQRIWGTYYGGERSDEIYTIYIDDDDNIYIGGTTESDTKMTTPSSFESSSPYTFDKGFFAKLNSNGQRIWGSYLGTALVHSIIFKNNSIYIGASLHGGAYETQLTNTCSYRKNNDSQGFLGKFSKNGDFIWGTFLGNGWGSDSDVKIALDTNNAIFVSGIASKNNGITDNNSYQPNLLGNKNYFLMKFSEDINITSPVISSNSPVCIGKSLELKASGSTNYIWTGPNGFTSIEQNPTITNATNSNSGEYSCLITGTGGCDGTGKINILIGDIGAPIPDLVTLPAITGNCHTAISTIPTATDACAGSIQATTLSPLSYTLPGTYTVVWNYNDGNGNTSTQDQTVIITAQPIPTTTSPQTFCIDQNATLTNIAIQGQNIQWYDALTGGNTLLSSTLLQNGITYYASQTINSCESLRMPVTVNIQNTPIPTGISDQTFCANGNPTLNEIAVSGTDIIWYDSLVGGSVLPSNTTLQNNTTYYCSQTINGCESLRNSFIIQLINTLNANDYSESFCDDLNDGFEIIDLRNYNASLISTPENFTFGYYNSLNAAINKTDSDKVVRVENYSLQLGLNKIYVRIDSDNGCHQVVELSFNLYSKPIISISDLIPICENKNITVNAGSGFDSYLWSTGATSSSITVDKAGNYNVTVTQNHGNLICSTSKNFSVVLSNVATINSIDIQDWTDNKNVIVINTTGYGDYEYSVDGIHFQNSNTFSDILSGTYTITVRDKNGCGIVKDDIFLLMYPKFFTPNGDGYNDLWNIKFSNLEPGLTVKIFDRYGKFITTLNYNDKGWDGTLNGKDLPSTDYWFVVTRANGKEFKGHFSLKR